MKKLFIAGLLVVVAGCNGYPTDHSGNPNAGDCAQLPAGVTIDPASACTSSSGQWTSYTVNQDTHFAFQSCGGTSSGHYVNQADFDANEGTSTVAGVTIVSNHDYVVTSTCASGSTVYTSGGTTTHYLYIWQKAQ